MVTLWTHVSDVFVQGTHAFGTSSKSLVWGHQYPVLAAPHKVSRQKDLVVLYSRQVNCSEP